MDFTPRLYETSGSAVIGGRQVDYRTECGDWPVYAEDGGLLGTMFSYAYLSTSQEDSQRPVVFAFNGGPGSSSPVSYTHLFAVAVRPGERGHTRNAAALGGFSGTDVRNRRREHIFWLGYLSSIQCVQCRP